MPLISSMELYEFVRFRHATHQSSQYGTGRICITSKHVFGCFSYFFLVYYNTNMEELTKLCASGDAVALRRHLQLHGPLINQLDKVCFWKKLSAFEGTD